jgi:signal transduction histidine kinase
MTLLFHIESSAAVSMASHQCPDLIALEELMAGLAHELNNPLSVIAGQALLLQETASDARTAERARKIEQAAERSARIIRSILAMARRTPVQTWNVDLNEVIHDALEARSNALRDSHIQVSLCLEEGLPPVRGDAGQLGQVITNLLVNAQQAMEENGRAQNLIVKTDFRNQEGQVVVKVIDNGPGIPAALRSRVFEPFFTSKNIGVGTGIGLALSKRIVEAHGGTLALESS